MSSPELIATRISAAHLAKLACVYVRQSSPGQVAHHGESTDLQYELVQRARQYGWLSERIQVIDEDLGKSGASADQRPGFQHLLAEISLGRVGVVVSLDASRLARNNSDWHQLLELCSVFGVLLADSERLYDPRLYHDRLLLGLSGIMSEAELHSLKMRLQAGGWHKAERGELAQPLPVGLVRLADGMVQLNPDEEIQARLRLVFGKFQHLGSARAVVRYLQREHLRLPARPLQGPAPHVVVWQPPTVSGVLTVLKNPAYAGAYVYGRRTRDPAERKPGQAPSSASTRPLAQWPILLHDIYPAYITWDEFLDIQARLQSNRSRYKTNRTGVPREGAALLQGIVRCGRCGAHMQLRYSGPSGEYPVYVCVEVESPATQRHCQQLPAHGLDTEVAQLVLASLAPDQIVIALATADQMEQEAEVLRHQHQLHLERLRYEAERARRQFEAVEPEDRLVARTLERQWEDKLRGVEQGEQEYEVWARQQGWQLTPEDRRCILELGEDLPGLWQAATTMAADRKQIVRLVVQEVIVDRTRARGRLWFQINWQTGACSEHWVVRSVEGYADYADLEMLQRRISELQRAGHTDGEIAGALNADGLRTARGRLFQSEAVRQLRQRWHLAAVKPFGKHPLRWMNGAYSVQGAAEAIGVVPSTIFDWLRTERLHGSQHAPGMPWSITLSLQEIETLRAYADRVRPQKTRAS